MRLPAVGLIISYNRSPFRSIMRTVSNCEVLSERLPTAGSVLASERYWNIATALAIKMPAKPKTSIPIRAFVKHPACRFSSFFDGFFFRGPPITTGDFWGVVPVRAVVLVLTGVELELPGKGCEGTLVPAET